MNHLRLFFSGHHGMARRSFRTFLGLSAMALALTMVVDASADPKGDPKDSKGQHDPNKGPPGDKAGPRGDKAGPRGEPGRSGPEGRADPAARGMRPHERGAAGAPGVGGPGGGHHGHGMGLAAIGKRLKELREKEKAGKLSAEEKTELARLIRHPGRHRGILRQELIDELTEKEKAGKLNDEDKTELEKARKLQAKHDELKKAFKEKAEKMKSRAREEKRAALKEFPRLNENAMAVAEYKKHAERLAKLERAKELGTADENTELVQKVDKLIAAEKQRHQAWLNKNQPKAQGAAQ